MIEQLKRLQRAKEKRITELSSAYSEHGENYPKLYEVLTDEDHDVALIVEDEIDLISMIELLEPLILIAEQIRDQDNRATDQPMFCVQQLVRHTGRDGYNASGHLWFRKNDSEDPIDDPRLLRALDADKYEAEDKGYRCWHYEDRWEIVDGMACFTEKGCQDHIDCNAHNLNQPRIYAMGSFRNREFQTVRNFLLSLVELKTEDG